MGLGGGGGGQGGLLVAALLSLCGIWGGVGLRERRGGGPSVWLLPTGGVKGGGQRGCGGAAPTFPPSIAFAFISIYIFLGRFLPPPPILPPPFLVGCARVVVVIVAAVGRSESNKQTKAKRQREGEGRFSLLIGCFVLPFLPENKGTTLRAGFFIIIISYYY